MSDGGRFEPGSWEILPEIEIYEVSNGESGSTAGDEKEPKGEGRRGRESERAREEKGYELGASG
jgi:hypothetical protein